MQGWENTKIEQCQAERPPHAKQILYVSTAWLWIVGSECDADRALKEPVARVD